MGRSPKTGSQPAAKTPRTGKAPGAKRRPAPASGGKDAPPLLEFGTDGQAVAETRRRMIAEAAYLRAERRGFEPFDPVEDWLQAEREVDERLGSLGAGP